MNKLLAKTIYDAYPDAEALAIDPPEADEALEDYVKRIKEDLDECGDTLFMFIMRELHDCLDAPIYALSRAIKELEGVRHALTDKPFLVIELAEGELTGPVRECTNWQDAMNLAVRIASESSDAEERDIRRDLVMGGSFSDSANNIEVIITQPERA